MYRYILTGRKNRRYPLDYLPNRLNPIAKMKVLCQLECMSKDQIKNLIERRLPEAGLVDTALKGVQLFRVTEAMPCVPAVYEPTVVAILSGSKEAVLDGEHHVYGSNKYLLCPMTLPVEAGTPLASEDNPLLGGPRPSGHGAAGGEDDDDSSEEESEKEKIYGEEIATKHSEEELEAHKRVQIKSAVVISVIIALMCLVAIFVKCIYK